MLKSLSFDRVMVPEDTRRRLILSRTVLVSGEILVVFLAQLFSIRLPLLPMLAIIALQALLNLAVYLRHRRGEGAVLEVFLELSADATAIAALVYFSGGYANPFISLLLLPLILCAVAVPTLYTWVMTLWVAVLYSLLARFYQPLTLLVDSQTAIDLHLAGMWLNFLFTAVLVAAFLARLMRALRQQDAALAQAREKSLRDEQLFALGMQAASAAHDLATPLSTLSVTLKEWEREYAGDDELSPGMTVMRSQTDRMKEVLGRLAMAAGAASRGPDQDRPLADWLAGLFSGWSLMWPEVKARLTVLSQGDGPKVREDAMLVSVVASLLNNAARVSPEDVELEAAWDDRTLLLNILDRGPGLGTQSQSEGGWGVGLKLADAALERYGGRLDITARDGGGVSVALSLPLSAICSGGA